MLNCGKYGYSFDTLVISKVNEIMGRDLRPVVALAQGGSRWSGHLPRGRRVVRKAIVPTPEEVAHELLAQIIDKNILRFDSHLQRFCSCRLKFLALPQVSSEGHHLALIVVLQPLQNHRRVQTTGVSQNHLLYITHFKLSKSYGIDFQILGGVPPAPTDATKLNRQ